MLMDVLGYIVYGPQIKNSSSKTKNFLSKQGKCGSLSCNLSRLCFRKRIFNDRERKLGRKETISNMKMVIP